MKVSRERYQHGSVRKVPRSQGFAWEFRFYLTAPDGKRKLKVQTFDSLKYPTERDVRKAVEGQLSALNAGTLGGKLAATLGTIIERYMSEDFLTLRHSTQTTNKSLINLYIKPRWEHVRLDKSRMCPRLTHRATRSRYTPSCVRLSRRGTPSRNMTTRGCSLAPKREAPIVTPLF
jgi:hypothetical protein